ncbi:MULTISPECIES: hypothetical protein [Paenibacillus]|uniref:hypothetical protein n=1 Tax=Paenibacillus TaxID=44249 RepID=UPI002FE29B24
MAKSWTVMVDGSPHEIGIRTGPFKCKITVDGVESRVKSRSTVIRLIDEPIVIGSKTLNLTAIGGKVDLAVDGFYLNSAKPYIPLNNIPGWSTAIMLILTIFGLLLGGLISCSIGVLGGVSVVSNSLAPGQKSRLPVCLAITAATVAVQIAYVFLRVQLMY